jgi:hypothetical protein
MSTTNTIPARSRRRSAILLRDPSHLLHARQLLQALERDPDGVLMSSHHEVFQARPLELELEPRIPPIVTGAVQA